MRDKKRKAVTDRARYLANRDKILAQCKARRLRNPEQCKAYRLKHKERDAAKAKLFRIKNRKRRNEYTKAWKEAHREHWLVWRRNYNGILRRKPETRIVDATRLRIWRALKGLHKSKSTMALLGCGIEDFKLHIESNWESGMSWDNYGEWHLDHMIPCAVFDLSKPEHQSRCFHFSNVRPMWALANISKGKKLITNQYNLL